MFQHNHPYLQHIFHHLNLFFCNEHLQVLKVHLQLEQYYLHNKHIVIYYILCLFQGHKQFFSYLRQISCFHKLYKFSPNHLIKFRFVAHFSYSNYTIKLVNSSTATLDYMRKVRTVFCPDFLAQSYINSAFTTSSACALQAFICRSVVRSHSVQTANPLQYFFEFHFVIRTKRKAESTPDIRQRAPSSRRGLLQGHRLHRNR